MVRFRHEELKETKKHHKRELTLKAIVAKEEKKKLKAETMILQIEKFDCHGAVVQKEKRIKFLADHDLRLSRDDAIRSLGKLPDIRMDEDYDDLDIGTLLQSDEEDQTKCLIWNAYSTMRSLLCMHTMRRLLCMHSTMRS